VAAKAPPERRWRNRPLVRERDEQRVRWLWRMLAALVAALAPAGTFLLQSNECLQISYSVNTLRDEHEMLVKQERRLRFERARLESLPRIESWAVRKHGLTRPAPEKVVVVSGPATPDEGDLMARAPARAPDATR